MYDMSVGTNGRVPKVGSAERNQGGAGKITTLNLRGAESDHVLVLVDGVRMGSATAGLPALQDLPIDQIDRVEIVRGPRSSLWGSEAIGGVIQVFTRRGRGDAGVRGRARIGAGSHGLREASAGIDLRGEKHARTFRLTLWKGQCVHSAPPGLRAVWTDFS